MLTIAAETYQAECSLNFGSISVSSAWIGNGRKGFIWSLHPKMRKKNRSLEDNARLEMFKHLIGTQSEPMLFYPVDKPEPLFLRERGTLTEHEEEMLWETSYACFESGEMSADSLVGGIASLAV
jgi:hypothetical protein